MDTEPIAVALKFGFLAVLYLFLFWVSRSALKELRKTNPDLKFIFVSGYPDDAFKRSLDENESYAFLPKPFTLPQLAAKVKEQLGS